MLALGRGAERHWSDCFFAERITPALTLPPPPVPPSGFTADPWGLARACTMCARRQRLKGRTLLHNVAGTMLTMGVGFG